jgi:hypothetical protein
LANGRALIGTVLNHDKEMGIPIKDVMNVTTTPLSETEGPYKDLYPEFLSMWREVAHTSDKYADITLFHKLEEDTVFRSMHWKNIKGIEITHTPLREHEKIWRKLESLYKPLLTPKPPGESSGTELRDLINEIYFYTADALFSKRGSAAISEMLYHVLEKGFLGSYSYLGGATSAYGHALGLTPDLLAMISKDFSSFNKYFKKHILEANQNIKVVDVAWRPVHTIGIHELQSLNDNLKIHEKQRSKVSRYLNSFDEGSRRPKIANFIKAINFLSQDVVKLDDPAAHNLVELF